MADHRPNKGWLLFFGALLVLGLAYVAYGRWRHFQLAKKLRDPDPIVRMDVVRKTSHEDLLIEALHDDDPDIRYVAAWGLGGAGSREKVRALLELFKDDHAYVRAGALKTLRFLPVGTRRFIYKGVEDADPRVRAGTAYSLVYLPRRKFDMGEDPPPRRPQGEEKIIARLMIPLIKDEDLEVRKATYYCLFTYWLEPEEARQVASALEESLPETDKDARDLSERLFRWMKQGKPARNRDQNEE